MGQNQQNNNNNNNNKEKMGNTHKRMSRLGTRHSLAVWASLGFIILFILRINMTITLVVMASTNSTHQPSDVNVSMATNASECSDTGQTNSGSTKKTETEFQWSNTVQGFVLSAFFYGYFATQIPGSFLANKVGGKFMFAVAMAGTSVLTLLTPLSARVHVGVLIANRVLQGCLQGLVFPAMQCLLSKWVPAKERSRLVAFTYAGCQIGTVIGLLGAGYICDSSLGWPVVFYIGGVLGLVWCAGWMVFVSDSPSDHPRISEMERVFIESSVDRSQRKPPSVPWKSIFTSPAMYGIVGGHLANDWGCFAIMTCVPKFMKDILNYDVSQNGFLSSLPYLAMWICNLVAGTMADLLRGHLKTAYVRKIMIVIGLLGPASLLLTVAYLPGCGRTPMVILLTAAMGLSGFTIAGHSVNHLDIAPVFASLLFSMTNTFGTTTGWIGPALAGALTDHHDSRASWQTFFLISAGVFFVGGSLFVLLARGEVQPWAKFKDTETEVLITPDNSYGSTHVQRTDEED